MRGNDFAPQPVGAHLRFELPQRFGKIPLQRLGEGGIVWRFRSDQCIEQVDLGVGDQLGEFGAREPKAARAQRRDFRGRRQPLNAARQFSRRFQALDETLVAVEIGDGTDLRQRKRTGLLVIVGQHQRADIVGHRSEQLVARFRFQGAGANDIA